MRFVKIKLDILTIGSEQGEGYGGSILGVMLAGCEF